MNIGILTFHKAINFGAAFQAYALQSYLVQSGHNVCIIDYVPKYLLRDYKILNLNKLKGLLFTEVVKLLAHEILSAPSKIKRKIFFKKFHHKRFRLMPFDTSLSTLDAIVFGSDQIWNIEITGGIDPIFWGRNEYFKNKKLISYAASAGYASVLEPHIAEVKKLLSNFHAIGVRERDLYNLISGNNAKVRLNVDPVILAGTDTFRRIAKRESNPCPYLLLFQLGHNPAARQIAERIAKEKGLDIREVLSLTVSFKGKDVINAITPERLLGFFEQCDFVVTSSFHGTVLSLINNKEFVYVQYNKNGAERVKQLLSSLGISERHISGPDTALPQQPIDYINVANVLDRMRQESVKFLNDALS